MGFLRTPVARLAALTLIAALTLAAMAFPFVGGAGILAARLVEAGPRVTSAARMQGAPTATTLTDSAGKPFAYLYDQFRLPATSAQISPAMKAAIVAIEDRRFFEHGGVDPVGTLRALIANLDSDNQQGGSTLTQQYVKNYELYVAAQTDAERRAAVEPSLARKAREALLAIGLGRTMSKDEILGRYLDLVYFGHGAYGVGAAAQVYFGTTADALTVPQAALLAGMVQSPTAYDPVQHPDAAKARRDQVIEQLRQQGFISDASAAAATAAPLGVVADPSTPGGGCIGAADAAYFCAYVRQYLVRATGLSERQLATGGYTVRTTLDRRALDAAKAAVDAQVPPATPHIADVLAFVAPGQDAHRVSALAANRTYGTAPGESSYGLPFEPVNFGAGSVYKIFTAASALEQGVLGINTVIDVPPSGYASPLYRDGSGRPTPVRNAGDYASRLSLTDALAQSPNTAFIKLEEHTGIAPVVEMAQRLGVTSLAQPMNDTPGAPTIAERAKTQASFTLGVTPTSSLELANVAATLASHGTWCPPTPIVSVTDRDGKPVGINQPACRQAVDPGLADALMTGLSRDNTAGGTAAAAAAAADWRRPMAGKTGTTETSQSAAFVGATPELAGASIVFDDTPSPRPICDGRPPTSCGSGNLYGGTVPARTFYQAATDILGDTPATPLPPVDPRYLTARGR